MERDSFIFYRSFQEAIKELPEKEQLPVYKAITEYALNGTEIEMQGISKAIFTLIKPQLDANLKRYLNGKQPKQKQSKVEAKEKQNISKNEANVNDNENENVNVNENKNDNANASDSCVDGLQKVIDFYENNIGPATPYTLEIFQDFMKEMPYEVIIFAMKKAVEANVRTIQYIKGTLNNWSKKGVKTLVEAKEESAKFSKNKKLSAEEEFLSEYE